MIEPDLSDTHLCIKCSATIVGLEIYIRHRKQNCGNINNTRTNENPKKKIETPQDNQPRHDISTTINNTTPPSLDNAYESFTFVEPDPPSTYISKDEHDGKNSKTLNEAYPLPYELRADVFFSSLQLQSVQSTIPSTTGKTSAMQSTPLQRQHLHAEHDEPMTDAWIETHTSSTSGHHNTETLMKALRDMSEVKKPFETMFKPLKFDHESPEASDDDDEDEIDAEIDDDDDEDYDPIPSTHTTSAKWKLQLMRHSPPIVPITHTGGKWRPENRPNLRVTHTQLTRLSPSWDENAEDLETIDPCEEQHPPADHTKGKWIPGSKMEHLEYQSDNEIGESKTNESFWCNICCRKLKSRKIYDNHLGTSYHLKRAEPEQQLEKASLDALRHDDLPLCTMEVFLGDTSSRDQQDTSKQRKRRAAFIRCELCKHLMLRHLIGKHLISHYHYRRMKMYTNNAITFQMILDNIHSVVLQAPYQCSPCRFYANTEVTFLQHWNSTAHIKASTGPGNFWCSYCQFECKLNSQMWQHLVGDIHKEVILGINRSVPICISKKISINCNICHLSFRYNVELRTHFQLCHEGHLDTSTASDVYQSRYYCNSCSEVLRSKIALQRHEKNKHSISKYFCSICKLEFNSPAHARRHRKSSGHKKISANKTIARKRLILKKKSYTQILKTGKCKQHSTANKSDSQQEPLTIEKDFIAKSRSRQECKTSRVLRKCKSKEKTRLENEDHECMCCGENYGTAQALGRHSRICQPIATTSAIAKTDDKVCEERKKWKCTDCNFSAAYESDLIYHRLHHTYGQLSKNQIVGCPFCSKSFRKHSLRCHIRQHTNEKIFKCNFCEQKFSRRHNLKNHIGKLHSSKYDQQPTTTATNAANKNESKNNFICDTCGKVLASKYTLQHHSLTHKQVERSFHCTFEGCQYSALTKPILKAHCASHSQEIFKCEHENCKYIGKSLLHLKRHSQRHSMPSKLHSCDQCNFKARIKGHVERHMRCHTGEKPHQCPYCKFRCSTFDNLRKHILKTNKHPGKFIYECKFCIQFQFDDVFKSNSCQEFQSHLFSHNLKTTKNLLSFC